MQTVMALKLAHNALNNDYEKNVKMTCKWLLRTKTSQTAGLDLNAANDPLFNSGNRKANNDSSQRTTLGYN